MSGRAARNKQTVSLLDGSVLIALVGEDHISHERAARWWERGRGAFATCPITQGTLVRALMRDYPGATMEQAKRVLAQFTGMPGHVFWPDDLSYEKISARGIIGHRQVTDAYLAALARSKGGVLVTMDKALAALNPDVCELI